MFDADPERQGGEDDLRWVVLGIDYLVQAYATVPSALTDLEGLAGRVSDRSVGCYSISFWDLT